MINKKVKLEDVVNVISKTYQFKDSEPVIFINTGDISEGKFLHSNRSYPSSLPGQAKKSIKKGDILFSEIRPANKRYALVDFDADNYVVSTKLMVLRPKDNIDPQYLYIWLTMPSTLQNFQMIAESRSGTFPQITFDAIKNEEIPYPSLPEQHRIANILSSFDNKIELLKKENNTLEDIAQSIFKEWFIKYNFPNKDGKPYRDNNGKMIDSELGLIPEGWRVGKLGEFGKIVCGKTPSKNVSEYFNGIYPFIKIPDMQNMFIMRSEDSLTDLGAKQLSGKLLPSGSICVSCIATIGKVSITTQDSFTNQQINTIIPKEGTLEYLYFTLSNMKGYLEQIGNRGSTTFNINTNMFATLDVLIPEHNVLRIFNQICDKIFIKTAANNKVLSNLDQQKNISLYKLIN
jgi:type I restriction enzyme S subunit